VLRQECDEVKRIEDFQVFFEVVVVGGVEENLSVQALEAHLLERDWGTCQVLRKALPLFPASARQQDGGVDTEAGVSPGEKIIGHVLVDELSLEK
jgi:hypothetical protein